MTHVRTKDATMHIDGPDDSGHYWLHLSASGETCRMDLGRPRGMIETALLMAASVKFGRPGGDYTLAPHLQKIVDGAKIAPQWDTQEDRLAPTDAAQAKSPCPYGATGDDCCGGYCSMDDDQKGGDAHDRRLRSHEASPAVTASTDAAQARELAEDDDDKYLIIKRGVYFRPNRQGYTSSVAEAGRYTLAQAVFLSHPNGPDGPRDGMSFVPLAALIGETRT